jgi:hypothetical protein
MVDFPFRVDDGPIIVRGARFTNSLSLVLDSVPPFVHIRATITWESSASFPASQTVMRFHHSSDRDFVLLFDRYRPSPYDRSISITSISIEILPFPPKRVPPALLLYQYLSHAFLQLAVRDSQLARILRQFHDTSGAAIDPVIAALCGEPSDALFSDLDALSIADLAPELIVARFQKIGQTEVVISPVQIEGKSIHAVIVRLRGRMSMRVRYRVNGEVMVYEICGSDVRQLRVGEIEEGLRGSVVLRLWVANDAGMRDRWEGPQMCSPDRPVRVYALNESSRVPEFRGIAEFRAFLMAQKPEVVIPYRPGSFPFSEVYDENDNSFLALPFGEKPPRGPHHIVWKEEPCGWRPLLLRGIRAVERNDILAKIPDSERGGWEVVVGSAVEPEAPFRPLDGPLPWAPCLLRHVR